MLFIRQLADHAHPFSRTSREAASHRCTVSDGRRLSASDRTCWWIKLDLLRDFIGEFAVGGVGGHRVSPLATGTRSWKKVFTCPLMTEFPDAPSRARSGGQTRSLLQQFRAAAVVDGNVQPDRISLPAQHTGCRKPLRQAYPRNPSCRCSRCQMSVWTMFSPLVLSPAAEVLPAMKATLR